MNGETHAIHSRKLGASAPARGDDGSVEWMMAKSPRLALARALGLDFVPFSFDVSFTFPTAGSPAPGLEIQSATELDADVLITEVQIDVQDPNAFVGNVWKPTRDLDFARTSGVQVATTIDGYFKRRIDAVPIWNLTSYATECEPWILLEEQSLSHDFIVTTPLPFAQTTFTVSYVGKIIAGAAVTRKNYDACFCQLDKLGYDTSRAREVWGATT